MKQNKMLQSGRSMVEMLGTLAIIGVLSVGGIAGYSYGMDKYRANTIINDIMLRAVDVKAQFDTTGDANLSGWATITAGKYTIGLENETTGIQVDGLPERLCEMVFDGMINNATVKIGATEYDSELDTANCGDTNTMVFYVDEEGTTGDGQEGDNEPDLCATITCRECTACNANTGRCEAANENLTCGKNREGVCESGVCLTDGTPDITSFEECSSDNECGDTGCATCDYGYCNLRRQDEITCIKDGISGVCRYGICYTGNCPQEGCPIGQYCADTNESCDVAHPSVCANMIDFVRKKINVNGIEETWYISKYRTSWWEAQAVCAGLGKTMPSVSDLMDSNGKRSIALFEVLGQETMYLWTSDLKDSCYAYYVLISSYGGSVSEGKRHYGGGMHHSYAACK